MTLTRKVILLIVGALGCVTAVVLVISSLVVLRASHELEMARAGLDTRRTVEELRRELAAFGDRAQDWFTGCDAFSFVWNGQRVFIDSDLTGGLKVKNGAPGGAPGRGSLDGDLLRWLKASGLVLADAAGKVIYAIGGSPQGSWQPLSESVLGALLEEKSLTDFRDGEKARTGFLSLAGEMLLVVSQPIPVAQAGGAARGSLIMFARLDEARLRAIGEAGRLKLSLLPPDDAAVPAEVRSLGAATGAGVRVVTRVTGKNIVSGYAVLGDMSGRPAMVLREDFPREFRHVELEALRDFVWYLIIVCAVGIAASVVMVKRFMSRLKKVSAEVNDIAYAADVSRRLEVEGKDELAGIARGINEMLESLHQAQGQSQESEDRYRTLVESATDAIIVHRAGTFLYANEAAQRIFGADSFQDLMGRSCYDFLHPEDRQSVIAAYEEAMKAGRFTPPSARERRIVDLDGRVILVESVPSVVVYQGEPALQVVMRDITLRKRAEEELRKAKEQLEVQVAERSRELKRAAESLAREVDVRRRAEEALRESEERYRAMIENAPFGVVIHQDGVIRYYNTAAREIVKYSPEDVPSDMGVFQVVHPDDHALVREMMAKRLRGEAPANYEVRVVCKDGEVRTLDIGNQLFPYKGKPAFMLTALDITERKKAEQALRESEEKFRTLANQLPNQIFIQGEGRVRYANRRCEEVMGYSREEYYAPDFDFFRLIAPESRNTIMEALKRHRGGQEVTPYEYTLMTKNGRRIESILTTRLIKYEGQNAILGIVTDITERKKAEEALRESEEKFRTLAERLPGLVFINSRGRVVYANRGCETVMKYTREELYDPSFHFERLIAPESLKLVEANFQRHARGEEIEPYECSVVTKDGRRIDTIIATKLMPFRGENAILGVVTDITERKLMEEEIRRANEVLATQNEELMKLDRIRDGLLRDVSHELKTPVAKHQMQLELLKKIAEECELDEKARNVFRVMEASIRRQESVIRNILDLSRLEAGGRQYRREPVALGEVVREALTDYQHALEMHGVEVSISEEDVIIESDRDMLWHVFSNIINNAIKFRRRTRPKIDIDIGYRGDQAAVVISDNGIGLDSHEQGRVFERFYKGTSSTEGAGVGLNISRRILKDLGGQISIDSEGRGQGATVTVTFPPGGES